jgi:AAA+ superfamily predicted ATPase
MFLTTNRFGTLDHAFCSRIDLIIPFANLDQLARGQVWKTFIETLPGNLRSLEDADYESLSEWQCNGREIKSAVKTGLILAKSENDKLRLGHLQAVLRTRQEANEFQQRQQDEARRLRASG